MSFSGSLVGDFLKSILVYLDLKSYHSYRKQEANQYLNRSNMNTNSFTSDLYLMMVMFHNHAMSRL